MATIAIVYLAATISTARVVQTDGANSISLVTTIAVRFASPGFDRVRHMVKQGSTFPEPPPPQR
ncbi:MAG: hypothetical protein WCI02_02305 [Planctomycetota bacterium]